MNPDLFNTTQKWEPDPPAHHAAASSPAVGNPSSSPEQKAHLLGLRRGKALIPLSGLLPPDQKRRRILNKVTFPVVFRVYNNAGCKNISEVIVSFVLFSNFICKTYYRGYMFWTRNDWESIMCTHQLLFTALACEIGQSLLTKQSALTTDKNHAPYKIFLNLGFPYNPSSLFCPWLQNLFFDLFFLLLQPVRFVIAEKAVGRSLFGIMSTTQLSLCLFQGKTKMTENTCFPLFFQTGKPGTRQKWGEILQQIKLRW